MAPRQVLVTVGTTKFDLFITTVCSPDVIRVLKSRGYNRLLVQVGNGKFVQDATSTEDMQIDVFRFKDSLKKDIEESDLVISHAGAGTCLEVLEAKKSLVVVVNELLMDNHQIELAQQLYHNKHAYYCTCNKLKETLKNMDLSTLKPLPKANRYNFVEFLNNIFGF